MSVDRSCALLRIRAALSSHTGQTDAGRLEHRLLGLVAKVDQLAGELEGVHLSKIVFENRQISTIEGDPHERTVEP